MAERKIARINGIALDVVISETPDFQSEVTAYPVENGEDISDHVHNQPVGVTIEAVVSGMPIDLADERGDDPIVQVRAALEELRATRQPFVYEGLRFTYPSMVFESLSFPFDPSAGNSLRVSASMRRVNQVDVIRASSRLRPSPKVGGPKIWLCPFLPAAIKTVVNATGPLGKIFKPTNSTALNKKAGCREVVKRNGFFVFADNGKKLNAAELDQLSLQNDVTPISVSGSAVVKKSPGPGVPLSSLPTGGQPVAFAPGAPAVKKMSQAKIPPPTPIGLPQMGDEKLSF
ncbi:MAG: phage baseplate protein [Alsobacter sp.]